MSAYRGSVDPHDHVYPQNQYYAVVLYAMPSKIKTGEGSLSKGICSARYNSTSSYFYFFISTQIVRLFEYEKKKLSGHFFNQDMRKTHQTKHRASKVESIAEYSDFSARVNTAVAKDRHRSDLESIDGNLSWLTATPNRIRCRRGASTRLPP